MFHKLTKLAGKKLKPQTRVISRQKYENTFNINEKNNNEKFRIKLENPRIRTYIPVEQNESLVIGGHNADVAILTARSVAPDKVPYNRIDKIHTPSYPNVANPAFLAQDESEWGQVSGIMPKERKIFEYWFHRYAGKYNSNIQKVEPTEENVKAYLHALKEGGIQGALNLGYYPTHKENPTGNHTHLEEAIIREAMTQFNKEAQYENLIRADSNVKSVNLEEGTVTLASGKELKLPNSVKLVFDCSSELTRFAAFTNKIPTQDMHALTSMSPGQYANKPVITIGSGQSVAWEILYFLLKTPNPVSQLVIGLPPGRFKTSEEVEQFLINYQKETDPYKKLDMLFAGQVIEKNLRDILAAGGMKAIEENRLVFFAQDNVNNCTVTNKDGLTTYEGTNLGSGKYVGPTSTTIPIIAATGVFPTSKITYSGMTDGSTIFRSPPKLEWYAPGNVPPGSMINLYHRMVRSIVDLPNDDILGMPLNRYSEICIASYQEKFAAHGLNVPTEFFNDLGKVLKAIPTDTIYESNQFDQELKKLLDKHLPGKQEKFLSIWAEVTYSRDEQIEEYVVKVFEEMQLEYPEAFEIIRKTSEETESYESHEQYTMKSIMEMINKSSLLHSIDKDSLVQGIRDEALIQKSSELKS